METAPPFSSFTSVELGLLILAVVAAESGLGDRCGVLLVLLWRVWAACLLTALVMEVFSLESTTRGDTSSVSPSLPLSRLRHLAGGPSKEHTQRLV